MDSKTHLRLRRTQGKGFFRFVLNSKVTSWKFGTKHVSCVISSYRSNTRILALKLYEKKIRLFHKFSEATNCLIVLKNQVLKESELCSIKRTWNSFFCIDQKQPCFPSTFTKSFKINDAPKILNNARRLEWKKK